MKFKYQKKHKQLKSIKRALGHVATAVSKAFFYLGTPALCPYHQACLLSGYYPGFYYLSLGYCPGCNLCSICSNQSTLCSGNFTNLLHQCESSANWTKWTQSTQIQKKKFGMKSKAFGI